MINRTFKFYQIKDVENCPYYQKDSHFAFEHGGGIQLVDYHKVYERQITAAEETSINDIIEFIYEFMNVRIIHNLFPNYKGRQINISDIIEIENKYYYYDSLHYWVEANIILPMKYGIKIIKDGNVFHYKEDNKVKYFESKDDAIAMMELLKETMKLYYSFEIMEKKVMI